MLTLTMAKKKGNPSGVDRGTRQSRTSLAAYGRARFPQHLMYDMYMAICMGYKPKLEKLSPDDHCSNYPLNPWQPSPADCECGWRVQGMPEYIDPRDVPTVDHVMLAMARMADRNWGQPAQHTHIEAEIKAEVTAIAGGVDPRYFQRLSPEALRAISDAVRGRVTPSLPDGDPIQDAEVVAHDPIEVHESVPMPGEDD